MPPRLPLSVVLRGLGKQAGHGAALVARYLMLLGAWVWVMPYALIQPFRWYFDSLPELYHVRYAVDPVLGLLLIGCIAGLVMGVMLMREWMEGHGLFDFLDEAREADVADETEADGELSPVNGPPVNEPGSWLEHVTPREYRSFLRRREYHREKNERLRVKQHVEQAQKNAEILRMIDHGLSEVESLGGRSEREDSIVTGRWETETETVNSDAGGVGGPITDTFNPYMLDTDSAYRFGSDHLTDPSMAPTRRAPGVPTAPGVVFRESFRCRVCQKRSCISREHVLQASAQQRTASQAHINPAPNNDQMPVEPARRGNNWPFFDWINREIDEPAPADEEAPLSFSECVGIEGPFFGFLRYWIPLAACLHVITHAAIILPIFLGSHLVHGSLPWLRQTLDGAKGHAISKDRLGQLATGFIVLWDRVITATAQRLPILYPYLAMWRPAVVRSTLKEAYPLIIPSELGPVPLTLLKLSLGYASAALPYLLAYHGILYWHRRPYGPVARQFMSLAYLYGAFAKFLVVHSSMLFAFPLFAGFCLDYVTLPLTGQTLRVRLEQHAAFPALSLALHWAPGLLFSLLLAHLITACRRTVRPGLLHWIRNPDDPETSAVKEALDRPLLLQFMNLAPTFIFYGAIIWFAVGWPVRLLTWLFPSMAPLRMSLRDPVATIPFDILAQGLGKLLLDVIDPYALSRYLPVFFKSCLRRLRLSSFFLGGRFLPEESFPRGGTWAFVPDADRLYTRARLRTMKRRQPQPMDVAKLPIREGRATPAPLASVDLSQIPQPRRLMTRKPSKRSEDTNTKGFTVVFRPNHLALRVLLLMGAMWLYWLGTLTLFGVIPLFIGRFLGSFLSDEPVRDTFAFAGGFVVFGLALRASFDLLSALYAADPQRIRAICIDAPLSTAKIVLVAGILYGLWPLLVGTIGLAAFSALWSRMASSRLPSPTEAWSAGLLIVRWALRLRAPMISAKRAEAIQRLHDDGWRSINLPLAMRNLLVPVTIKLVVAVAEPFLYGLLVTAVLGWPRERLTTVQSYAYALAALRPLILLVIRQVLAYRRRIIQDIRDDTYLVGQRLHNLEPVVKPQTPVKDAAGPQVPSFRSPSS